MLVSRRATRVPPDLPNLDVELVRTPMRTPVEDLCTPSTRLYTEVDSVEGTFTGLDMMGLPHSIAYGMFYCCNRILCGLSFMLASLTLDMTLAPFPCASDGIHPMCC